MFSQLRGGIVVPMTNNVLNETTDKVKKLRRSREDRMLAGVCGGAAKMLGVDATLLRIGLVAATLFGFGAGAVLYVACWVLMPEEEISTPDLYQPQDTTPTF
ncbi:phage shock protein C (PspC) family protein [Umezawaea tangerina]|uniref:Phage shock protein C (PspC) family protein n=2 Tax=Umezawaea tangerina TaxID=84725 RepID=A0A2T0TLH8_9PSEU|nr:phage shock protein C (PspC) family protein [Umezawaea tangerina]